MPNIDDSMHSAGALADALQDLLRQMIDKIIGGPSQGKGGEPLRDVCYMVRPLGDPIDPRDFSFQGWTDRHYYEACSNQAIYDLVEATTPATATHSASAD